METVYINDLMDTRLSAAWQTELVAIPDSDKFDAKYCWSESELIKLIELIDLLNWLNWLN